MISIQFDSMIRFIFLDYARYHHRTKEKYVKQHSQMFNQIYSNIFAIQENPDIHSNILQLLHYQLTTLKRFEHDFRPQFVDPRFDFGPARLIVSDPRWKSTCDNIIFFRVRPYKGDKVEIYEFLSGRVDDSDFRIESRRERYRRLWIVKFIYVLDWSYFFILVHFRFVCC